MQQLLVIFIHGYSVSSLDTYGALPRRLQREAGSFGFTLQVADLYLTRYISFSDQVTLNDLATAFEIALSNEIYKKYPGTRFVCITHSTGGPLVRNWLDLYYPGGKGSPLSHLVMLAPANHGSALAQLGKSKAGRLRAWFNGQEPGQKILDWLELGSAASRELNKRLPTETRRYVSNKTYFFVVTGQDIDRKMYDHINSYTGEPGSDGVVRVASANLNNGWLQLEQQSPATGQSHSILQVRSHKTVDSIPFRIVPQRSHSGTEMGIMRSVLAEADDSQSTDTVNAIFRCMQVASPSDHKALADLFFKETTAVQRNSLLETEKRITCNRYYIHDRHAMLIFVIRDSEGHNVEDYDLVITGPGDDADALPPGFFRDRQCNSKDGSVLTYYFNYDMMVGCPPVVEGSGKVIRPAQPGISSLGLHVIARPEAGMVRYVPAVLTANAANMKRLLRPNATTLVEITLQRLVSAEIVSIENIDLAKNSWGDTGPGNQFIG